MASLNNYRKRWLRYHKEYEKRAYKVFKRVFKKWSKDVRFDEMTLFNYPEVLDKSIDAEDMFKAFETVYTNIGLVHGKRLRKEIKQEKFFTLDDFPTVFQEFIKEWLRTNAAEHITLLADSFKKSIRALLTEGIQDGKTLPEIARELRKLINKPNFYKWQSMRIARTETTTSANLAAFKQAELLPFEVEKRWISANDARTRRLPKAQYDHFVMNNVKVDLYDYFEVPSKLGLKGNLLFPGDTGLTRGGLTTTQPGNIINCRCTVGFIGKRDKNGNLIPK